MPNPDDAVEIKDCIDADDRIAFDERLSGKHAIERIAVMRRHFDDLGGMSRMNRKESEIQIEKRLLNPLREWERETELPDTDFDRDLPDGRGADETLGTRRAH